MLLLTAFEPFDGSGLNSSLEALRLFESRHPRQIEGVAFSSAVLPVVFDEDVRVLERAIAALREPPRAILHLGQTYRGEVAVEERAVNQRIPDNGQDLHTSDELIPICKGAPPFLDSTFPAAAIIGALQSVGIACRASQDAGTYLCNHILFRSLHHSQHQLSPTGRQVLVGFLHLPRLPEQIEQQPPLADQAMPLEMLVLAVEVAARAVAQALHP